MQNTPYNLQFKFCKLHSKSEKNKHFEGSCELLSKQFDLMSISVISILDFSMYISLTLNVTL